MLKAIIVDDEMRARRLLQNMLLQYCADVEVEATCANVNEALVAIEKHQPHLLFCDIEMRQETGFDLFKRLDNVSFQTIFTTGHRNYALEAFEVSAIDYLLKPIDIEKLEAAVEKVRTIVKGQTSKNLVELANELKQKDSDKLEVKSTDGVQYIRLSEILYFEADGAYTRIVPHDSSSILSSRKLKMYEDLLADHPSYFRTHRSFLVNVKHLKHVDKARNMLTLSESTELPISRDRKADFLAFLKESSYGL